MSVFSERLTNARKLQGWSRKRAVSEIGIPYSTYSGYEQGLREPDLNTMAKLATKLKTSTDYLTGKTDDPSAKQDNKVSFDLKDNPHLLDMLSYNGQHLDDETKKMYIRLARSQMLDKKDSDKR